MARLTPSQRRQRKADEATLRVRLRQGREPMRPPVGFGAEPYREKPHNEERVLEHPALASLGPVADLAVQQWAARQPGIKPGTLAEGELLQQIDDRREEALAEESRHKSGLPRGVRVA